MSEQTLEQKVQRALDVREVENVMARHAYYHALDQHHEELDAIWVRKTPNPTFSQNQGSFVGYESVRRYYGEINIRMHQANLSILRKHYPNLSDDQLGAGTMIMHPLTMSIVEVARDAQTAKGMWYSPGQVTEIMPPEGKPVAHWIWEKYGVDFAKEDGVWKIWHLLVCTDFFTPLGASWATTTADAPLGAGAPLVELLRPEKEDRLYDVHHQRLG